MLCYRQSSVIVFEIPGTPFPEVDKCIQQFVNETRQFPDFVDICEVIRSSSEKNNLKLTDKEIQDHGMLECTSLEISNYVPA